MAWIVVFSVALYNLHSLLNVPTKNKPETAFCRRMDPLFTYRLSLNIAHAFGRVNISTSIDRKFHHMTCIFYLIILKILDEIINKYKELNNKSGLNIL